MSRIIFIDGTRVEHVRRGSSQLCSKLETLEGIRRWVGRGCAGRCSREIEIVESNLSQRSGGREGPHVA